MIIVLTGHCGFIGRNLKTYLEKLNHTVIGLDKKEGQDILDCPLPNCDIVIHLAAETGVTQSLSRPHDYWKVNVDGTRRILLHYKDKRILAASSSSQYEPYLNPYAATKHIMEKIPHNNVCWMRFHTVYGRDTGRDMFFDKLRKNTVTYVTDHERDFIHIDDVCDAVYILLNNGYIGPVDIGTGNLTKISNIRPDLPVNTNTPNERKRTCADTRLMESFGFKPKIKYPII